MLRNNKPYKNTVYSRLYFYEQQERALLKPLPVEPFAPKKVTILTVQRNYHVQLREDCLYYSVPYQYIGKKVKVLHDRRVGEVYYDNSCIALHIRRLNRTAYKTAYRTIKEHMPPHHLTGRLYRKRANLTNIYMLSWNPKMPKFAHIKK